jgi:probable HAF family extracellular repeat protein
MKSKKWTSVVVMSLLTALATPVWTAAQANPSQDHKPKHQQYRLFDVGTFGGPTGWGPGVGNGGPVINRRGAVVGNADTTVLLPPNPGFDCFPGPYVNHAFKWQDGQTVDLGSLPPAVDNCSLPQGINDRGIVVGSSENGVIDPLLGVTQIRAVVWKNDQVIDLGTFGGNESLADSINNRGQVAGFALNAISDPFSIFDLIFGSSNGTQTRAFLWDDGNKKDLGTLGGPDAFGVIVNERGQVAGQSYTNSTPNSTTGVPTMDPFLWEDGKMRDLGSLGGTFGFADALNSRGQVAGQSNLAGDLISHPFFWTSSLGMQDLGTFGGNNGLANAMNDHGEVVGKADLPGSQTHDAFLWKEGIMKDLGRVGADTCSNALAINSSGKIVGCSSDCVSCLHAFLWENNGPVADLNDLVSPKSDVQLIEPQAIGDNGEIFVDGLPPGCSNSSLCGHVYVLIPQGDCGDDCEGRIAETQSRIVASRDNATLAQNPATMKPENEALVSPLERIRSQMRQRYHVPGQPPAPRD